MKKILVLGILFVSFKSYAIENTYRPYVGVDYSYSTINQKSFHSYLHSGTFAVGSEYNKYFSTEVFYQRSAQENQQYNSEKIKSVLWGYGLDIYAYLPMFCSQNFAPYATTGIGHYTLKRKIDGESHNDHSGFAYRFGAGIIYHFSDNIMSRIGYRYINFDKLSDIEHSNEFIISLRYKL